MARKSDTATMLATGRTLPPAVIQEVAGDWADEVLAKSDGLPERSSVTFPLEDFATATSNRGYDVVQVARQAAKATLGDTAYAARTKKGYYIGSKTATTDAVTDADGTVTTPPMLTVETYWKVKP
jgi:hypothetical protein